MGDCRLACELFNLCPLVAKIDLRLRKVLFVKNSNCMFHVSPDPVRRTNWFKAIEQRPRNVCAGHHMAKQRQANAMPHCNLR